MGCLLLYYVTDRTRFPGSEEERRAALLDRIAAAAAAGVDYIQLREKDLAPRVLESLARDARVRLEGTSTKLFINSRVDVAIAAGAQGVHLPANEVAPAEARRIFKAAGIAQPIVAASCHTADEVRSAHAGGADFVVFGPVFEKDGKAGTGVDRLREACVAAPLPVLALGGVTTANAAECMRAGAAGIAAIRLFQEGDRRSVEASFTPHGHPDKQTS